MLGIILWQLLHTRTDTLEGRSDKLVRSFSHTGALHMKPIRIAVRLVGVLTLILVPESSRAQDTVTCDPQISHPFENDAIRLRSVMTLPTGIILP